jgi:hypothetical protein
VDEDAAVRLTLGLFLQQPAPTKPSEADWHAFALARPTKE